VTRGATGSQRGYAYFSIVLADLAATMPYVSVQKKGLLTNAVPASRPFAFMIFAIRRRLCGWAQERARRWFIPRRHP
jgi:hypothetical protein